MQSGRTNVYTHAFTNGALERQRTPHIAIKRWCYWLQEFPRGRSAPRSEAITSLCDCQAEDYITQYLPATSNHTRPLVPSGLSIIPGVSVMIALKQHATLDYCTEVFTCTLQAILVLYIFVAEINSVLYEPLKTSYRRTAFPIH